MLPRTYLESRFQGTSVEPPAGGALLQVPEDSTVWLSLVAASAAELNFSPDRPGLGESTGVVGAGHVMVEGGLVVTPTTPSATLGGWVGRIGIDDGIELRVRAPDLGYEDAFVVGPVGLGAKLAGAVGERWSVSVVPELALDPTSRAFSGLVNANLGFAEGPFGIWAHASTGASSAGVELFVGGGTWLALGPGGAYLNGGYTLGADVLAGGGGWLSLSERVQLDVGLDMVGVPDDPTPLINAGVSLGW